MTVSIPLKGGASFGYCAGAIAAAVIQFRDPAIVKGARNGAAGTSFMSLEIWDTSGTVKRYTDSNFAYLPDGFSAVDNSTTVKDIYDEIVALPEADEVLPTSGSGDLSLASPYRATIVNTAFREINTRFNFPYKSKDRNVHIVNLDGGHTFYYVNMQTPANLYAGNGFFELSPNEFIAVGPNLEGLC